MSSDLKVTTYTPDSALRRPGELFRSMGSDLMNCRGLAWRLFVRNISAAYRQTLFGYVWAFLPPLFTAAVFIGLRRGGGLAVGDSTIPPALWTIIGVFTWQVFADAVMGPMKLITQSKEMLAKINFPREALILAGMGEVLFNFMIRFILLAGIIYWYKIPINLGILVFPVSITILIGMGTMIGLLFSPLGLLYQDLEKGLPLILPIWMMISDVAIPLPKDGFIATVGTWNPVTPIIRTARDACCGLPIQNPVGLFWVSLGTLTFLGIGWLIYRVALPHLISRIPA